MHYTIVHYSYVAGVARGLPDHSHGPAVEEGQVCLLSARGNRSSNTTCLTHRTHIRNRRNKQHDKTPLF